MRPSASNTRAAPDTYRRGPDQVCVPSVRSTGSHAACASAVPPIPSVAPIKPTALPPKARGMSFAGRDSQSITFLSTPGMEIVLGRDEQQAVGGGYAILERPYRIGE